MAPLTRLYHTLASLRHALTFTALAGIFLWLLSRALGNLPPGAPNIFDLQLAFTVEKFQAVLAAWGGQNVRAYINSMWLDFLFPIAYALALSSWLALLTHRTDRPPARPALLLFTAPFLAALLDYVENALHLLMLAILHTTPPGIVFLASLAAACKWTLAALALGGIAIALVARLKQLLARPLPPLT